MFVMQLSRMVKICSFMISVIVDPPAVIFSEGDPEAASVVPVHMDRADVIDTDHGSERPDGRSLWIIHPNKLNPAAPGEPVPQALDSFRS
jgi:hypothetical protein